MADGIRKRHDTRHGDDIEAEDDHDDASPRDDDGTTDHRTGDGDDEGGRHAVTAAGAPRPHPRLRAEFEAVSRLAHSVVERYERAEIDAVYLVYNEFK